MIPVEIAELASALAATDGRGDYDNDDIHRAHAVAALLDKAGVCLSYRPEDRA